MAKTNPGFLACIVIFFLAALATIIALTVLYVRCQDSHKKPKSNYKFAHVGTQQMGQKMAASYIQQGLNPGAEPCADFYDYACGKWSLRNPIPPYRRRYNTLIKLQDRVTEKIYTAIHEMEQSKMSSTNSSDISQNPFRKLQQIFTACTRIDEYTTGGKQFYQNPLIAVMQNTEIGLWPLMNYFWAPENAKISFERLAGLLAGSYGVNNLLTPSVSVDWKDTTKHVLYLDTAELTLGLRVMYQNRTMFDPVLGAYRDVIMDAANEIANDMYGMVPLTIHSEVRDIINFEVNLSEMMSGTADVTKQYNPYTLQQLEKNFPNIKWHDYFAALLPNNVYRTLGPNIKVVLIDPGYVRQLDGFLSRVPPKSVYNYLVWRLVYSRLWSLSNKYRTIHRRFRETVDVSQAMPSQRVQCVGFVKDSMGFAVGRLFVKKYFDTRTKPYVADMVEEMVRAFKTVIDSTEWMDQVSKEKAISKISAITKNAAYPEWIYNDTALQYHYRNLTVDNSQGFFTVYNSITAWRGIENGYDLLKPSIRQDYFGPSPATVNAWYNAEYNSITFPAGLLEPPVIRMNYPAAVKFGGLGTILAHELMHAVDHQGINFGPNGTVGRWMDDSSMQGFTNKSQCLIRQYDQFCYPDIEYCVNGRQTLQENLADNGGLKIAFQAYRNYMSSKMTLRESLTEQENPLGSAQPHDESNSMGSEEVWEDSNGPRELQHQKEPYNGDQLFFLSFARLWCGVAEETSLRQTLLLDPHPPDKARVIGALRNNQQFAETFSCPANSLMISKQRC